MASLTPAHKSRIHFVVFPDRSPHSEEFGFVMRLGFRWGEAWNDSFQLFSTINCARVRGQQTAHFPAAVVLFRLEPLEELHCRAWVITGAREVEGRQAVGAFLV